MLALAVVLLAANLVFSACLAVFVKRRLSRDRLLGDVEKELDLLYKDIQREIDSGISIIEDRTAALKSLIEAADKRILLAASEIEKREKAASFAARTAEAPPPEPRPYEEEDAAAEDAEAAGSNAHGERRGAAPIVYTKRQVIARAAEADAQRLAADAPRPARAEPIKPEIPVRERVVMLARQDISPEEIAKILSIPQSEVDLILALDL